MKLEDQCISLELAKRLKELGVKQHSCFYYVRTNNLSQEYSIVTVSGANFDMSFLFSSFTVAELGDILPKGGWTQESTYGGTRVWFIDPEFPHKEKSFTYDESEANARAKMLIYLIENKLIETN